MLLAISATLLTYHNSHPNNMVFLFNFTLTLSALDSSIFCRHSQRSNPGVLFEQCFNSAVRFLIKRKKRRSREEKLFIEQIRPAMRFSAADLHPFTSSRIVEFSVKGVPQPSMFAWQLVKVSSKPQGNKVSQTGMWQSESSGSPEAVLPSQGFAVRACFRMFSSSKKSSFFDFFFEIARSLARIELAWKCVVIRI